MRLLIDASIVLLFGLILFGAVSYLRSKKNKTFVYLMFFTIFYVYLFKVLDYTLFQFQSLLLLKHFAPNLILRGQPVEESLNLIPLVTLGTKDVKTSLLNILLLIPFGFGLPFITNLRMKQVTMAGALLSIIIEFLQLITGLIANMTFRVADINDLIFNTAGAAIGYVLFVGFVSICRRVTGHWKISANPISRYMLERPQFDGSSEH